MLKIGAHQSIAGGYSQALDRIKNIGGNCLQIFSNSPRSWNLQNQHRELKGASESGKSINLFISLRKKLKIDPVYFHASYLINLADSSNIGHLSKASLVNELNMASQLGIKGSIIHLGSYKNLDSPAGGQKSNLSADKQDPKYQILIKNIKEVLNKTPKETLFIIENAGNRKIGQTLEEIGQIVKDVNDPRVRICLDTCHLFSNGYKFESNKELSSLLDKLDELSFLDKLELWHVNDSRDEFNSGHDRHENIGQGTIGLAEFKTLLNHPKTKNYSFIIETPGFDNNGPDKKNLKILKSLIN